MVLQMAFIMLKLLLLVQLLIDTVAMDREDIFSPDGTPYAERALPPFMERQPYNRYRVVQPFDVKAGEIAPWFNQPGKGIQFLSEFTLDELKEFGVIEELI